MDPLIIDSCRSSQVFRHCSLDHVSREMSLVFYITDMYSTDAPLLPHLLRRLAQHAGVGIAQVCKSISPFILRESV
jgi:hypothetical protein